ncbi:myosin-10-like [Puntigrus tetrazona]|uniref:myosin-10-like n=1 Tax=Puntigrus tetrazona TaxID=1606681 RepID=UPI001C89EB9C|nr:myosin-10-like [Puntigrus tetrazona]
MVAKNRNKSGSQPSSGDRAPASAQPDDAPKNRSPRAARADGGASGSLVKLVSALSYLGFVAGTVIASVSFYQELSNIKQTSSRHEESVQKVRGRGRRAATVVRDDVVVSDWLTGLSSLQCESQIHCIQTSIGSDAESSIDTVTREALTEVSSQSRPERFGFLLFFCLAEDQLCCGLQPIGGEIRSMQASLEALESTVLSVRTDLERTGRAVQTGEDNTRRLENALQKLQSDVSQELRQAVQEVKATREQDASSLEERLSQLSRSTAEASVQQSRFQSELQELRARVEKQDAPADLRQELTALGSTVERLSTASEVSEGNTAVLREHIAAVSAELQTRNKEVASVSEGVEAVRRCCRAPSGPRGEVSTARASAQSASDHIQSLADRLEMSTTALQSLETQTREQLSQLDKHREDAEVRLKSVEESQEAAVSSLTEQTNRLNALEAEQQSLRRSLDDHKTSAEKQSRALRDGLEELQARASEAQELERNLNV